LIKVAAINGSSVSNNFKRPQTTQTISNKSLTLQHKSSFSQQEFRVSGESAKSTPETAARKSDKS
jgi:hypothetical protein